MIDMYTVPTVYRLWRVRSGFVQRVHALCKPELTKTLRGRPFEYTVQFLCVQTGEILPFVRRTYLTIQAARAAKHEFQKRNDKISVFIMVHDETGFHGVV